MAKLLGFHITATRERSRCLTVAPDDDPEVPDGLTTDNARAVADFAATTYADENTRTKDLDGKAAPVIAATGAAILLAASSLVRVPDPLSSGQAIAYFFGIVASIVFFILAQVCFLKTVAVRTYYRVPIAEFTDPEAILQDTNWLFWRMSTRLERVVQLQHAENDKKAEWYQRGLRLLVFGVTVLAVTLVFVGAVAAKVWL